MLSTLTESVAMIRLVPEMVLFEVSPPFVQPSKKHIQTKGNK